MHDVLNIDMWKFKMSAYFKAPGLHAYLATSKKSYVDNDKYLEANAQAMEVLKQSLSKNYLSMFLIVIPPFVIWNTLTSLKKQASNNLEKEPIGDES